MRGIIISTKKKEEIVDITSEVKEAVTESGVSSGICLVFVAHTTAALMINENADPNIGLDILSSLSNMVPNSAGYRHDKIDGNAAAHIKAALLGPSLALIIHEGSLLLGRWQAIMLCELDGPRQRQVFVETLKK